MAEPTPIRVAMKAEEIEGPSVAGADRFWSTWTSPMTVPMIPIVGANPPAFSNGEHAGVVPGGHTVDLGLEDVADELGVGAVDDQLEALLGERVVDLGDLGVERQQALASRLLGERDEEVDAPLDVERVGADHPLVQRGDLLHPVHADARHRRAGGAGDDEDERGRVHERGRAGPVHHRAHQDPHGRDSDSYAGCGLHDPVIGRAMETFTPLDRSPDGASEQGDALGQRVPGQDEALTRR